MLFADDFPDVFLAFPLVEAAVPPAVFLADAAGLLDALVERVLVAPSGVVSAAFLWRPTCEQTGNPEHIIHLLWEALFRGIEAGGRVLRNNTVGRTI